MRFKAVILVAVAAVFAYAGGAAAQTYPAFPNNSSIFQNVSGTFSSLSGVAKRFNVIYVTSASSVQRIRDRNGTDNGILFQSSSDNFWQFADTIVFPTDTSSDRLDIDGFILPFRNGREATGSAYFAFTSPAGNVRNGPQLKITGGAVVRIVGNRKGTSAAVKVFNIQGSEISVTTFRNSTAISLVHGDAIMTLAPMVKSIAPYPVP